MVRKGGLEPPCLSAPPPQDGVSANFTTSAHTGGIGRIQYSKAPETVLGIGLDGFRERISRFTSGSPDFQSAEATLFIVINPALRVVARVREKDQATLVVLRYAAQRTKRYGRKDIP
jgi:hypothetical protein